MGVAFPTPGAVIGMDFVGRVIKKMTMEYVGEGENCVHVGDLVCGMVHGSNPSDPTTGAFAEYVRAATSLLLRVPDGYSLETAASLGTPLLTSCLALWTSLSLPLPGETPLPSNDGPTPPVLVYGGSTACGTMAIQLLRILGYDPVTTCSPTNFNLVNSYGAGAAFDYTSDDLVRNIKEYTGGRLRHALDCMCDQVSTACCYASLGRPGGRYAYLEASPRDWKTREAVKADFVMALEAFGKCVGLPGEYGRPASQDKHHLSVQIYGVYQQLLDDGRLKGHPTEIVGRGLESVLKGLAELKSGSVSGKRLVVWME
ncbi:polyketide synthase enoylreductase [Apiospora saccharicola]|uniref:Polyketide synthase enoylreductase n=1 Tax=Apiospora saccharicola TaxID=335842 RepID=A0ABR1VDM5_9PEZI